MPSAMVSNLACTSSFAYPPNIAPARAWAPRPTKEREMLTVSPIARAPTLRQSGSRAPVGRARCELRILCRRDHVSLARVVGIYAERQISQALD
eukprot:6633642-Pyramimonas_sp.AAC.1